MEPRTAKTPGEIIDAAMRGDLDETLAHKLHALGQEAVAIAALSMCRRIAEQGAELVRLESNGARNGHDGTRRKRPTNIDERTTHRLECGPHCRGELQHCDRTRTRIIEDIPEIIDPVVTEHTIPRHYCPHCKKHVEPVVPDAMPKAALGHQVIALTSWFHYGPGLTINQVVDILGYPMQTKLTPGGLPIGVRRGPAILPRSSAA